MTTKRRSKENRWWDFSLIRRLMQAGVLLTLLFSIATLQAQVKVLEVRDLKFLPQGDRSEARDVNNLGQVLVWSNTEWGQCGGPWGSRPCRHWGHFLWTEAGGIQEVPFLGTYYHANAINDLSEQVGYYSQEDYTCSYFWESGGEWLDFLTCGADQAFDLNNQGQVAGQVVDYGHPPYDPFMHPFLWNKEGGEQELPLLPGGYSATPLSINDLGQIAGYSQLPSGASRTVLWTPVYHGYRIQDLGPGAAYAINNLGQIVGEKGGHAVLWNAGASAYKIQDLGTGSAYAINDLGMVVGQSGGHAFVWTPSGGMQDLGTLPGFTESTARSINNLGQVVGTSTRGEPGWDSHGNWIAPESHATRWTLSLPPELGSALVVQPPFGQVGQELTVRIHVASAHFEKGTTIARFGEGISVGVQPIGDNPIQDAHFGDFGYVIVTSPTEALAVIRIESSAKPGYKTVLVNTGPEQLAFRNAFTVLPAAVPSVPSVLSLASPTTPDRGTPDQGWIKVSGTNFPPGEITAEQVRILLEPGPIARKEKREGTRTGSIPTVFTTATSIGASNNGSREVTFRIPDILTFFQSTDYLVSVFGGNSGSGPWGMPFASGNRAALGIDPTQAMKLIPLVCGRESSLRSVQEFTPTAIRFINWSTQVLRIYWKDYEGKRVFMQQLKAGGTAYTQPTFVTHPWLVTDNDGHCLGIFLPNERLGFAVIH